MQLKAETYEEYLEIFGGIPSPESLQNQESIIANFRLAQKIHCSLRPFTYLVDYSKGKYLFVEETCIDLLGYSAEYLMEMGHRGYYSITHPEYHGILTKVVFSVFYNFLKDLPVADYKKYVFSFNYRILNATGEYTALMQRHSYIPGNSIGNPAGAVGIIFDITHFRNNSDIICTIEEIASPENKLILKTHYPVKCTQTNALISKRELEVLISMAEGLTTKQIADRLKLSIHTISNHRKNMLLKTGARNSVELIRYGVNHGLM